MSSLPEVKKIIFSLANGKPEGIRVEKLDSDYKLTTGERIPYGQYGYASLLKFLENELNENLRIKNVGWNIMVYPIANDKSGHVVKLAENDFHKRNPPRQSRYELVTNQFDIFPKTQHL